MEYSKLSKENQERLARLKEGARTGLAIDVQRGKYLTESYKETEMYPASYRKAAALCNILAKKPITIWDDELIVGAIAKQRTGAVLMPDINASWLANAANTVEDNGNVLIHPEDMDDLREISDYWSGKCLFSRYLAATPQEALDVNGIVIGGMAYCMNGQNFGHTAIDFESVLRKGIKGLIAEVKQAQAALTDLGDPAQFDSWNFYKDVLMELDALINYAHRFSALASEMAANTTDPKRKAELEKIADVCSWVPENPPRDLQEAMQAQMFILDAVQTETFSHSGSLGRVDQSFYPYYKLSKEKGMTDEEATVLYAAFLLKTCSVVQCPPLTIDSMFGYTDLGKGKGFVSTIGGTDRDGNCAVNDMSYIVLDVERYTGFANDLMIRVNKNTPDEFLEKALRLSRDLHGKAKFLGDVCIMNQMKLFGRPEHEIGNYCVTGCTAPTLPSWSLDVSGGIVNLPIFLDFALHDGYSTTLKKQIGPHTGDPRSFKSIDDVWKAYQEQYNYFLPYMHILCNVDKRLHGLYNPAPMESAFYPECIRTGKDINRGALGKLTSYALGFAGGPNVSDSLMALKQLVFDEKSLTMDEIIKACDANFEGDDGERVLSLINKVPKYGNDNDEADKFLADVLAWTSDAMCAAPGEWGSTTTVAAMAVALNVAHGTKVGALPDGRKAGTPISEGGMSPHQGRNVSGATATFKSALKMPLEKLHNGAVLNLRFDPKSLDTDEKLKKLAAMVRYFLQNGGYLVQFNIVSTDMLRDAQKHPENYSDLLVRVATYSSYFVGLTPALQEDVISRLEQTL